MFRCYYCLGATQFQGLAVEYFARWNEWIEKSLVGAKRNWKKERNTQLFCSNFNDTHSHQQTINNNDNKIEFKYRLNEFNGNQSKFVFSLFIFHLHRTWKLGCFGIWECVRAIAMSYFSTVRAFYCRKIWSNV